MIKAIIFDFDGVILESADIKTKAFGRLFEEEYPEKVEEIVYYHTSNMGISRYIKFRYIYKNILKMSLSEEKENELAEKFSSIVIEKILNTPFVPGALEFLKENNDKYTLFIASGTPHQELLWITKERGVFQFFKEIHGTPPGKTQIIKDILERHQLAPEEVVFVGDAETDLKAALETGLLFVARIAPGCQQLINCPNRLNDLERLEEMLPGLK